MDQTTLAGWKKGEHQPAKRLLDKLLSFFSSFLSSASGPEE
jgi:hypothetical protein